MNDKNIYLHHNWSLFLTMKKKQIVEASSSDTAARLAKPKTDPKLKV